MSAFLIRNLKDIKFSIDSELNIVDGSRDFLVFFDLTDPKQLKLEKYMDSFYLEGLRQFLKALKADPAETKRTYLSQLHSKDATVTAFFIISKNGEHFNITLYQQEFIKSFVDSVYSQNIELKSLLKSIDRYYFVYENEKFHLKHSKEQNDIFAGNGEDFKNYLVKNFNINLTDSISNLQMVAMLYDVQKFKTKKAYNFMMINNKMISIHPEYVNTDGHEIIVAPIVTEAKKGLTENLYSLSKDGLTDMLNKKAVTEQIIHKIDVLNEEGSLIILDIDKFKDYNDTFGHAYGDKVIIAVANVIKEAVNDIGIAGRIGGDEFMIYIKSTDEQDIRNVTRNIRTGIAWAITSADPSCVVTCSMGIARFPDNGHSYEDVFKIADKCLYIAKNKGRNCYVIYTPEKHDSIIIRNEQEAGLKATGQLYNDDAEAQLKILSLLNTEKNIQTIIDHLREYLGITQITVFNSSLEPEYVSGLNPDFRQPYFGEDYFKYFNSYNFLHLDNTINFDVVDKEKHTMYRDAQVASTIEYVDRDEQGNLLGLVCFDVYKPARTFAKEKVVFTLMIAKLLTKLL